MARRWPLLAGSSRGLSSPHTPLVSLSPEDTGPVGLGPTDMTLFYLNHLFEGPISKCSYTLRFWGSGRTGAFCFTLAGSPWGAHLSTWGTHLSTWGAHLSTWGARVSRRQGKPAAAGHGHAGGGYGPKPSCPSILCSIQNSIHLLQTVESFVASCIIQDKPSALKLFENWVPISQEHVKCCQKSRIVGDLCRFF